MEANEETLGFKLSDYYRHCKEKVVERFLPHFSVWWLFAFVSAIPMYYVPQYAFNNTVQDRWHGRTDGLWVSGFTAFSCMVICHHVQLGIGTRTHTLWLSLWYLLSFLLFMPMTVYFNDIVEGSYTYMSAFNEYLREPGFWLALTFSCGVVILPYYAVHCIWYTMAYPEFYQKANKQ